MYVALKWVFLILLFCERQHSDMIKKSVKGNLVVFSSSLVVKLKIHHSFIP